MEILEAKLTAIATSPIPAIGTCFVCGEEKVKLTRTYFKYGDIKCECHSPAHFELFEHCKTCKPKTPTEVKITLKTS